MERQNRSISWIIRQRRDVWYRQRSGSKGTDGDYGNASSMHMKGVEAEKYIKEASQRIAKDAMLPWKEDVYIQERSFNNLAIIGTAMANQTAVKAYHYLLSILP